jgi:hypothetical protein
MNAMYLRAIGALAATAASLAMLPAPTESPQLRNYQARCTQAVAYFVTQIPRIDNGRHQVALGEAHRPDWVAAQYAKRGIGIAESLHTKKLAIDLLLFTDGVYQSQPEAYKPLAELWLQVAPAFGVVPAAGYYFKSRDAVHFSCSWEGFK